MNNAHTHTRPPPPMLPLFKGQWSIRTGSTEKRQKKEERKKAEG